MQETINPTEASEKQKLEAAVYTYITPHPLDHDSHWEDEFFTGIPGFLNERDEEQGTMAYLRDENIELYRRIEQLAREWLLESMTRIRPLLKDYQFRSVQMAVDLFGFILENGNIAGYNPEFSKPAKGVYSFVLSRPLSLRMLLRGQEGLGMGFDDENTLVHEVVHMLDHSELVRDDLLGYSDEPGSNLKFCMLKFRSEGIAELYHLLHGNFDNVDSIEEAKRLASEHLTAVRDRLQGMGRTDEKTRQEVFNQHIYYSVGPWLILDMLRSFQLGAHLETVEQCLATISKRESVAHDTILEVIKTALMINCHWFLEYAETELIS